MTAAVNEVGNSLGTGWLKLDGENEARRRWSSDLGSDHGLAESEVRALAAVAVVEQSPTR